MSDDYSDLRGSDAWQVDNLVPRRGDSRIIRHDQNSRWGSTVALDPIGTSRVGAQTTATVIITPDFDSNLPIAYQLRFARSISGPFLPAFPSGADTGAAIKLLKSVDFKAGAADESFTLFPGHAQPSCVLICRKLTVTVSNLSRVGVDPGDSVVLYVQAAACPVTAVDCDEITAGNGYSQTVSTFVAADVATQTLLAANSARAQFIVQNTSTNAAMILKLGTGASFTGPSGTFIIPANSFGIFESQLKGYTGIVTAAWNTGAPNGGALVTEGSF